MSRLQPYRPGFGSTDETSGAVLSPSQIAALSATGMVMRPGGTHFAYWSSDGRSPQEKLQDEADASNRRWKSVAVGAAAAAAVVGAVAGYLLGKKR